MENLINELTFGSEAFTPAVMVSLIVFCVLFEGFCSLIGNIAGGVKR